MMDLYKLLVSGANGSDELIYFLGVLDAFVTWAGLLDPRTDINGQ